jgi:hypothetical protein
MQCLQREPMQPSSWCHVSSLLSKLQVGSRRDAVRRGGELGIVV